MSRRRAPQPTRNSGPDSQGVIVEFLGHVANAITNGDGNSIAQLLVVDPMAVCSNTIYFNALRPEVNQNADTVEQKVEQALTDDWPSLNEAVVSYLYYIASFQPDMMNPMNPGAVKMMLHSFEKMKDFMNALNAAFNSARGVVLSELMRQMSHLIVVSAVGIDSITGDARQPSAEACMNLVLRAFNASLTDRTTRNPDGSMNLGKKKITLNIGNDLFRLYFKLNQIKLCETIHKNISATDIPVHMHLYPRSCVTTYTYYLGRHSFFNWRYTTALTHLTRAYALCHRSFLRQRRRILIYMIAAAIITGKFPMPSTLLVPEAAGLADLFLPVCSAIKSGDFRALRRALGDEGADNAWRKTWWRQQGLYLPLSNRTQILMWRALIKRLAGLNPAAAHTKTPTVSFSQIIAAGRWLHLKNPPPPTTAASTPADQNALFRASPHYFPTNSSSGDDDDDSNSGGEEPPPPPGTTWWAGGALDLVEDDVESIVISLIDQGLVKGYIAIVGDQRLVALSKQGAFPNVAALFYERYGRVQEERDASSRATAAQPPSLAGKVVNLSGVKPIG